MAFAAAAASSGGPAFFSSAGAAPMAADIGPAAATVVPKSVGIKEHRFEPYDFNGGTVLAIGGKDFVVVAVDTRLSEDYHILTRDVNRSVVLSPHCVLATGGCHTDVTTLHKVIDMRVKDYKHDHEVDIETHSVAQMLGNTLYGRRFFPYYAFNVLSGLDAEGKGAVYTYDAVGSFERVPYACQGAGQRLIIPYLDNVVGFKCRSDKPEGDLTPEEAVNVAKDAFITAAERQIRVGDSIRIFTIARGVAMKETRFEIRKD